MHYNSKKINNNNKKKEIPTNRPNNFQLFNRKQAYFFYLAFALYIPEAAKVE